MRQSTELMINRFQFFSSLSRFFCKSIVFSTKKKFNMKMGALKIYDNLMEYIFFIASHFKLDFVCVCFDCFERQRQNNVWLFANANSLLTEISLAMCIYYYCKLGIIQLILSFHLAETKEFIFFNECIYLVDVFCVCAVRNHGQCALTPFKMVHVHNIVLFGISFNNSIMVQQFWFQLQLQLQFCHNFS